MLRAGGHPRGHHREREKKPRIPGAVIRQSLNHRLLIAITGGSGSGKSWLADRLQQALGSGVERLSLDDFYLDRSHLSPARRARLNFDHPRAIDWKALEKILHQARRGEAVTLPCYDFQTHCRLKKKRELLSGPVLIMDGLWLLRRPSLRKFFDIKIYIDCPGKVRLERRIRRDVAERGRDAASVKRQFKDTVEPMHARFVAAQSSFANVRLSKDFGEKTVLDLARQIRERIAESAKAGKNRSRPAGATSRRLARDRK